MAAYTSTALSSLDIKAALMSKKSTVPIIHRKFTMEVRSTTGIEHYADLGSIGGMREWKNAKIAHSLGIEQYSLENHRYENTVLVDLDRLKDNQNGMLAIRLRDMAQAAVEHQDVLFQQTVEAGTSNVCFDGKMFFATDHASGSSGSQSNLLSYNVAATSNVPTIAERQDAVASAISAMANFKDDRGDKFRVSPAIGKMYILCPVTEWLPFKTALEASMVNSTTNVYTGLIQEIVPMSGLTAGSWYLIDASRELRPFVWQPREELQDQSLLEGSEFAKENNQVKYSITGRYAMGYGDWKMCIKTTWT